jgi:hypothetical protein
MRLRLSPPAARLIAGPALRALASSWRVQVWHEDQWRAIYQAGRAHVFLLWHEALLPLLWQHRGQGIAIVVSEAREGRYLADFAPARVGAPGPSSGRCGSFGPDGPWRLPPTDRADPDASSSPESLRLRNGEVPWWCRCMRSQIRPGDYIRGIAS